jgi:hypothetical protein
MQGQHQRPYEKKADKPMVSNVLTCPDRHEWRRIFGILRGLLNDTRGPDLTNAANIRPDLENVGGRYHGQPVVRFGHLITGQDPRALPAFVQALAEARLAPAL